MARELHSVPQVCQ